MIDSSFMVTLNQYLVTLLVTNVLDIFTIRRFYYSLTLARSLAFFKWV